MPQAPGSNLPVPIHSGYTSEAIKEAIAAAEQKGSVLGRGGFGVVFKCRLEDDDVAIKTFLSSVHKDDIVKEIRNNLLLSQGGQCSPHIVKVLGWSIPAAAIVMELAPFGTLQDWLWESAQRNQAAAAAAHPYRENDQGRGRAGPAQQQEARAGPEQKQDGRAGAVQKHEGRAAGAQQQDVGLGPAQKQQRRAGSAQKQRRRAHPAQKKKQPCQQEADGQQVAGQEARKHEQWRLGRRKQLELEGELQAGKKNGEHQVTMNGDNHNTRGAASNRGTLGGAGQGLGQTERQRYGQDKREPAGSEARETSGERGVCVKSEKKGAYARSKDIRNCRVFVGVAAQMAEGLLAMHSRNVLHLDVKPTNFLIDRGENVRTADIGGAKLAKIPPAELTQHTEGGYNATLAYADVRMLQTGAYSVAYDVFGYGLCLCTMLSVVLNLGQQCQRCWSQPWEWRVVLKERRRGCGTDEAFFGLLGEQAREAGCWTPQRLVGVVDLSLECSTGDRKKRPNMLEVLRTLRGIIQEEWEEGLSPSPSRAAPCSPRYTVHDSPVVKQLSDKLQAMGIERDGVCMAMKKSDMKRCTASGVYAIKLPNKFGVECRVCGRHKNWDRSQGSQIYLGHS